MPEGSGILQFHLIDASGKKISSSAPPDFLLVPTQFHSSVSRKQIEKFSSGFWDDGCCQINDQAVRFLLTVLLVLQFQIHVHRSASQFNYSLVPLVRRLDTLHAAFNVLVLQVPVWGSVFAAPVLYVPTMTSRASATGGESAPPDSRGANPMAKGPGSQVQDGPLR